MANPTISFPSDCRAMPASEHNWSGPARWQTPPSESSSFRTPSRSTRHSDQPSNARTSSFGNGISLTTGPSSYPSWSCRRPPEPKVASRSSGADHAGAAARSAVIGNAASIRFITSSSTRSNPYRARSIVGQRATWVIGRGLILINRPAGHFPCRAGRPNLAAMDAEPAGSSISYRSGAVEIDAMQRRVLIDGVPAKVGSRAFDVLLALVERRAQVVPKRELMDLVWPKLVVEESNLLVHMVALRKLLGPRAIVTIPGRGYRFVLPVDAVDGGRSADVAPSVMMRGNLPDSSALFGREQDLDAVDALLCEHAVVTIVGAGGIGKTRLAMAAASTARRLELPDGRWWVELAPVNEGLQVPDGIVAALDLQLPSARPSPEALAIALAGQKLLMVLDSCEHLAEEIASLVDLLRSRAPNVRLLVTSQESLKCRDEQV